MGWTANAVALALFSVGIAALTWGLLWRVVTWRTPAAEQLVNDEGLQIGSFAKPLTGHRGDDDIEVTFDGQQAFLVFGTSDCEPCKDLLRVASSHPATHQMRLVVMSDDETLDLPPEVAARWESYRFHAEQFAREAWKVPVSPYFHLMDEFGRVAAKGLANRPEHLDRLLELPPTPVRISTLSRLLVRSAP